jgi:hypothetical protein
MKTSVIYPIALMSLMCLNGNAQRRAVRNESDDNRSHQQTNRATRESSQNQNDSKYQYSDDSHFQQNQQNQYNQQYQGSYHHKDDGNKHNNYSYHNDCQQDNKNYHHGNQNAKHHHHDYDRQPEVVYYQSLPDQHYRRYCHNGVNYYHCNNNFYRYDDGFGYVMVSSPFVVVTAIPAYCSVHDFNGQRCHYLNGYYYVPVTGGWMVVQEPVAPQPHFSVSIRF